MSLAAVLVLIAKTYLFTGCCVGVAFLWLGIDRIDPAARGAYAFRPLILPGLVLLWPLVLLRWSALAGGAEAPARPPDLAAQRRWHLRLWVLLAVALGLGLAGAFRLRQPDLPAQPSQRLAAPAGGSAP